jgi:hypothetical protein
LPWYDIISLIMSKKQINMAFAQTFAMFVI